MVNRVRSQVEQRFHFLPAVALVGAAFVAACTATLQVPEMTAAGSGGATMTAGSGGDQGTGGAGGESPNDGGSTPDTASPIDSARETPPVPVPGDGAVASGGCGKPASDPSGQFVLNKTIMVDGVARRYHLRLPAGYNENRPTRLIFSFHACFSHDTNLVNIQNADGFDAIIIAPEQIGRNTPGDCFDDQQRLPKDLPVFDALVQWADDNLCVDKSRVFALGFSSGSWMANILACERSNIIRAKANVSGGLTRSIRPAMDCTGNVAGIFLHDSSDTTNRINEGIYARGVLLQQNTCSMTTGAYTQVPANAAGLCVEYQGCKDGYPVVWCQTTGVNHSPQQNLSPNLFWKFLTQF